MCPYEVNEEVNVEGQEIISDISHVLVAKLHIPNNPFLTQFVYTIYVHVVGNRICYILVVGN